MLPRVAENPKLLHYGLDCNIEVDGRSVYRWDKSQYRDFDALQCPPWALGGPVSRGGLFPHPPLSSSLRKRVRLALNTHDYCLIKGVS